VFSYIKLLFQKDESWVNKLIEALWSSACFLAGYYVWVTAWSLHSGFQELEKNETLHEDEEPEEGLKKNTEGDAEEDEETADEDEYDEMELEEVWIYLL